MKTLPIRIGIRHEIRAIATEADDDGHDPCKTLAFFKEQAFTWKSEMDKLAARLSDIADYGPPQPHDDSKFKKLPGTDGLFEFKSPQGLRVMCFWDDGGMIICTHGYVKEGQKAPKSEIKLGERMKRDYFLAKTNKQLQHVRPRFQIRSRI